MRDHSDSITMIHRHVAAALYLEQLAAEARDHHHSTLLDAVITETERWQEMLMQRTLDLLDDGPIDAPLPGIVGAHQSYLEPRPAGITAMPGCGDYIRRALITISQQALLDADWKDPGTAAVLGVVSKSAIQVSAL